MPKPLTKADLEAYLDEGLPTETMAQIERALRDDPSLSRELAAINARRDAGVHSLGEIWRRHRLTCPTRQQLGSFLLEALADEQADYIRFHVEAIGCRYCQANLEDLRQANVADQAQPEVGNRRRRYFQSSAGHLKPARQR